MFAAFLSLFDLNYGLTPLAAARAFADVEDADIKVLPADFFDVLFAQIAMQHRVILIDSRQCFDDSERAVAEPDVLCRRHRATAPTACSVLVFVH